MYNIFIFRRDLRLYDNSGLIEYLNRGLNNIIPIFIFTPEQIDQDKNEYYSNNSVQFMIESLNELNNELNKDFKKKIYTFYGDNIDILKNICDVLNIKNILFNKDYTKYAIDRDNSIKIFCNNRNISYIETEDYLLAPIKTFNKIKNTDNYYSVYTPFKNNLINNKKLILPINTTTVQNIKNLIVTIPNKDVNNLKLIFNNTYDYLKVMLNNLKKNKNNDIIYLGGRINGLDMLNKIKNQKGDNYDINRNDISKSTTLLSAYIKFGCISIREVYFEVLKHITSEQKKEVYSISLINQIIWREFYYYVGYYHLYIYKYPYNKKYNNIQWSVNKNWFIKWCNGVTGYPIVDACMRELNTTGYMHNRGRLISSSFIRLLNIDWKIAEKYFATKLVDYDPIINNLNWQNQMGTGTGRRPVIQQILNPELQSKKFDPSCGYIKKWIPSVKDINNKHLHNWSIYYKEYDLQEINYCAPILDYKIQREKNIQLYI